MTISRRRKKAASRRSHRLGELLLEAGIVSPEVIKQSLVIGQRARMPLGRVLVMSGHISHLDVECTLQTQSYLRDGHIEYAVARELLRFAHNEQVSLEEAYRMNGICVSNTNLSRLGNLIYGAGLIDESAVACATRYCQVNRCPFGRALVALDLLSEKTVVNAMNLQVLIRDGKVKFLEAVKALKYSEKQGGDMKAALSSLALEPQNEHPRMGQLLVAAGLLSRVDALVVLEWGTEGDKTYGELLLENELASANVVEAAVKIQTMFSNPLFTKARAVRLLRLVASMDTTLDQILEEFDTIEQVVSLLIAADVLDERMIKSASAQIVDNEQSVSEYLLSSGIITEEQSWTGLECLQAIKNGTMSYEKALAKLASCKAANPQAA